jgi:hypothetical protein
MMRHTFRQSPKFHQVALSPMCVFALGIEDPLMMPMDGLQHSHLREDHRPTVLGRPRVLAPFHQRRMAPFEKVKWPLLNLIDYRT